LVPLAFPSCQSCSSCLRFQALLARIKRGSQRLQARLHAARGATKDENGADGLLGAERRLTAGFVPTDWPAGKATTEATTVMNFGPHKPARMPALRPLPRPEGKSIFWPDAMPRAAPQTMKVGRALSGAKRLECVELAPAFCLDGSKSAGKPPHSKRFARRVNPCFIRVSSVARLHFQASDT